MIWDVALEPVHGNILHEKIDEAYSKKYNSSPYLAPMISQQAKMATIKILPKA